MTTNDEQADKTREEALGNSIGINANGPFIKPECIMPTDPIPGFAKGGHVAPYKFDPHKVGEDVIPRKPTERAPHRALLSAEILAEWSKDPNYCPANDVRNFYEAKITSGELIIAADLRVHAFPLPPERAVIERKDAKEHVLNCKDGMAEAMDTYFYNYIDFCPGCGAQIVE